MGYGQLPVAHGEFRVGKLGQRLAGGKKVLDVSLVTNNQKQDPPGSGKWVDDKEVWIQTSLWEKDAEKGAASLQVGDLVVAIMDIYSATYTNKEGVEVHYTAGRLKCPLGLSIRFREFPHHNEKQQPATQPAAEAPRKSPAAQAETRGGYNENATDDQGNYVHTEPAYDEPPF